MDRVRVIGNSEAIYYALDDEEAYIGATKTICSEMMLYFDGGDVKNIKFYKQPASEVMPMKEILNNPPELDGFSWDFSIRPISIEQLRDETLVMTRSRGGVNINSNMIPDNVPTSRMPVQKDAKSSSKKPVDAIPNNVPTSRMPTPNRAKPTDKKSNGKSN